MTRIYLSSTFEDLKEHRKAVGTVLRKMQHVVIGMEDYAAADDRALDRCVDDAGSVDIYVGIFAWRYGHVPEGTGGVSITECEYRAATKKGVTRLVFLLREDARWPTTATDAPPDDAAADKIRKLRETLAADHTTGFFTSPDDLAAAVAAAVAAALMFKSASASRTLTRGLAKELADLTRHEFNRSQPVDMAEVLEGAADATVLELDFGESEWWSTRMQLAALIASDYTSIEAIALLDRDRFVGIASLRALRARMRQVHPRIDEVYGVIRADLAPPDGSANVASVLHRVVCELKKFEPKLRSIMTDAWVGAKLGSLLAKDCVDMPDERLRAIDLYDILSKGGRFVGIARSGHFTGVVDRHQLATQIATTLVREQLANS